MIRTMIAATAVLFCASSTATADVNGVYIEARTCQVYTGPCFANAEVGLAGKNAIMAWSIEDGKHDGVDIAGMNVVVVVNATNTLAFKGMEDPRELKSVILVDEKANESQREALVAFAKKHSGRAGQNVVRVDGAPINMSLDTFELKGKLSAGKTLKLETRKLDQKIASARTNRPIIHRLRKSKTLLLA